MRKTFTFTRTLPEWSVLLHFLYTMEAREEGDWDEGRSRKSSLSSPFFWDSKLYPCQDWENAGWAKLDIILVVQNNVRWQWDNISS